MDGEVGGWYGGLASEAGEEASEHGVSHLSKDCFKEEVTNYAKNCSKVKSDED